MCDIDGCENPKEGHNNFCASHAAAARKAERESSKPVKLKKQIKKVSDKRKGQNSLYLPSAKSWLIGKRCQCCGDKENLSVHHSKGRENDLLMEKRYWVALCFGCHRLATTDSKWAKEMGISLPRNQVIS